MRHAFAFDEAPEILLPVRGAGKGRAEPKRIPVNTAKSSRFHCILGDLFAFFHHVTGQRNRGVRDARTDHEEERASLEVAGPADLVDGLAELDLPNLVHGLVLWNSNLRAGYCHKEVPTILATRNSGSEAAVWDSKRAVHAKDSYSFGGKRIV